MEYYSASKENEIMPFAATWIDLENTIPSEVSQAEKEILYITHMENLIFKMIQMNLPIKQNRLTENETYVYQGGKTGERNRLEVWDRHKHTTIFKIGNQQRPNVKHRNSAHTL